MPQLVAFLPGATGAADFWSPVAALLPAAWRTRLLAWPGAGEQPPDPDVNGYDDLVALAAAEIPDGSDVVAQSMGGAVAIGLALRHPQRVRRLVLTATSGGLDVHALGAADWRAEYRAAFPDAARWVTEQRIGLTPRLHLVTNPTCLIWGDADRISPPAVGRALHDALPHSTFHVIAGGTHALANEHPERVAALIQGHLT